MFFKIRNLLPLDVLICLHNALFLPFLQYGLIVWGQTYASYIDPIFKLQKKQSELSHFSLACLPLFRSSMILSSLNSLRSLNCDFLTFVFHSVNKLHLVAFMTFSYSVHLFISIPQDRPVKVIYICLKKQPSVWSEVYSISRR